MNEWFKKVIGQIKDLWSKWKLSQKIIFFSIIAVVIVALVLTITLSTRSTEVALFSVPAGEEKNNQIIMRLAEDNIDAKVNAAGLVTVKNNAVASKAKGILFREGILDDYDPWVLFDTERWTTTDFERDVNLQRSVQAQLKKFIESYDEVDNAEVIISMPKNTIFTELKDPVSVSVILTLKPGSDLGSNKRAIKGMQKLIVKAVAGLQDENVVITDVQGNVLNDFDGMADIERVDVIKKEQKLINDMANADRKRILAALQARYGEDRVRDLTVSIDMDMSEEEYHETTYTPVTKKIDNPKTPYDDSEIQDSITISVEQIEKKWSGTAASPEGPAGVEGQNPPVYADMSNLVGTSEEKSEKRNEAVNSRETYKKVHPKPGKRSVSVMIDGTWHFEYTEKGDFVMENGMRKRTFVPLTQEEVDGVVRVIKGAMGYDETRGDFVEVVPVQFERTNQFREEDLAYARSQNTKKIIFFVLIGVVAVLIAALVIRFIMKEAERKKRQREEEMLRQQQLAREKVIWEQEHADVSVTMSVEDKHKQELQDAAITAAKDHPEDVAQLIRTWLMEE